MSDIKEIVARKNPELLSIEDKAIYKVLPDELSINDIVSLITTDEENSDNLKEIFIDAVISGELRINNPYIARACIRPVTLGARWFLNATYEDIIANLEPFERVCNRAMINGAGIHKNTFKKYIDTNNFNFVDCLINNWLNELDIKKSSIGIMQDDIKTSKYKTRDNDFNAWISEKNLVLDTMTKANIQKELIKRNPQLWASGFSHWWKQQKIHKGQSGRKKKLIESFLK